MKRVRWVGPGVYRGWDVAAREGMCLAPGESREVSDEQAETLVSDFPGSFVVEQAPKPEPTVVAPTRNTQAAAPIRKRGTGSPRKVR